LNRAAQSSRNKTLDGLRGIAALIVVFHHTLLTNKWFADRVYVIPQPNRGHFNGGLHGLLEYTPLHILFAGTEAVVVFFVLSGYVLPFGLRKLEGNLWLRNRLIRLYGPIFGAVTISMILAFVVKRTASDYDSWWIRSHAARPSLVEYFRNLLGFRWSKLGRFKSLVDAIRNYFLDGRACGSRVRV